MKEMIDWKQVVIVQCIGYLIAVLMLPIPIRIIIDEFMGGKSYMTFPIVSFIVWLMLVVLPFCIIAVISTFIVMVVTGRVSQMIIRFTKPKSGNNDDSIKEGGNE